MQDNQVYFGCSFEENECRCNESSTRPFLALSEIFGVKKLDGEYFIVQSLVNLVLFIGSFMYNPK
jgi:hypothetical protein